MSVENDSSAPLREMWYFAVPSEQLTRGKMLAKKALRSRRAIVRCMIVI